MEINIASSYILVFVSILIIQGVSSTIFTFNNNCPYKVWPATLSSSGSLSTTGFQLDPGTSFSLQAQPKWSGRMWARINCATDSSGKFSCVSADCHTGTVECHGQVGSPPATLVEFTLNGYENKDFYDISLVDGFNIPVSVKPHGSTNCQMTVCPVDINIRCPPELLAMTPDGMTTGCKSACEAFGGDEFCCKGEYNNPNVCKPTNYSEIFKDACPLAYSYPYDDASSTFTCFGADYFITFCP